MNLLNSNMLLRRCISNKLHSGLTHTNLGTVTSIYNRQPVSLSDAVALRTVKIMRWSFDTLSGYNMGPLTCHKVINRAIFLETIAGVPGFVAGLLRHFRSLRRMKDDEGWIETLIGEAENERFHLLTFVEVRQPGLLFRASVLGAQVLFSTSFFLAYVLNPKFCHRFVGYLEEEAVKTYTDVIKAVDDGRLGEWKETPAPSSAIAYWGLTGDATMRDMILAGTQNV